MSNESLIERNCREIARVHGGQLLKLSPTGQAGIPDRLLLLPGGRVAFVEFKNRKGRLSELQRWWLQVLSRLGFPAYTCRSSARFREILAEVKAGVYTTASPPEES
jgi:VRR-NUC domain